MKKLLFVFIAVTAICFASCGNCTTCGCCEDTTVVDTTVVDTLTVDTLA